MKFVILFTCVLSLTVMAERGEMGEGPCKEDREKFCKDVKPGGGAMAKCMLEHKDSLSAACKEKMESRRHEMRNKRDEVKTACKEDIQKICPDVKGREKLKCMKMNKDKLSPECKISMTKDRN